MYNKKQNQKPLFAEVKLTGDDVREQSTISQTAYKSAYTRQSFDQFFQMANEQSTQQ